MSSVDAARAGGGRRIGAAELLSIDVDAELGALCEAQLHGPWQVPAELVRQAVRSGTRGVEVRARRGVLAVSWSGAGVEPSLLRLLRTALDQPLPAATRHRAIVELEAAGAQALLWSAGLPAARVEITSRSRGQGLAFEHRSGARPRLEVVKARPGEDGTAVRVSGARFDVVRALDWVRSACRFAPVEVTVDGARVWEHIDGALYRARIQHPLPGQLWITASGEAPCLWLLQHGVLSTRATVPGYPAFHAVLEMGGVVAQPSSSAALREAVTPHLVDLVDQAAVMLIRIGRGLPSLEEAVRQRVTVLLLRCARRGLRRDDIMALPLIPSLEPGVDKPCWLSVAELEQRLGSGRRAVYAVDRERRRAAFAGGEATVIAVSTEERSLLEEIVGRDLERPPASRRGSVVGRARRALASLTDGLPRAVWQGARGSWPGRTIEPGRLTVAERRLLDLVATGGGAERAVFREGAGAVQRQGRHELALPRHNPVVVACVELLDRDPCWRYPVLLALLGGRGEPRPELRSRWMRQVLRTPDR